MYSSNVDGMEPASIRPKPILRPARPSEAAILSALCLRSKAAWGYDESFMAACRAELSITAEDMAASHVQVALVEGDIAGVARLTLHADQAELEALFVEPAAHGAGIGRALFAWAVATARSHAARVLAVESDPHAAGFYRRMGAQDVGSVSSGSIPGRLIPKLALLL